MSLDNVTKVATICQSLANMSANMSEVKQLLFEFNISELDKRYSVEALTVEIYRDVVRKVEEKKFL